jgi:hypothetical protein
MAVRKSAGSGLDAHLGTGIGYHLACDSRCRLAHSAGAVLGAL